MKKNVFGRKFKRDVNERKALFKSLISSLVLNGRIKTTEAKAKGIKGEVDKIITKAKNKGEKARILLASQLTSPAIDKLIKEIAPGFSKRPGGYTRILKIGKRFGDDARMVLMEFVERDQLSVPSSQLSEKGKSVVGKPVNRKRANRKPKTENRKPRTEK